MISLHELRIGNLVNCRFQTENFNAKVEGIYHKNGIRFAEIRVGDLFHGYSEGNLYPIELTDKVLQKMGFEQYEIGYYRKGDFYLFYSNSGTPHEYQHRDYPVRFTSVHQLQNFIYAVTGEDFKPSK